MSLDVFCFVFLADGLIRLDPSSEIRPLSAEKSPEKFMRLPIKHGWPGKHDIFGWCKRWKDGGIFGESALLIRGEYRVDIGLKYLDSFWADCSWLKGIIDYHGFQKLRWFPAKTAGWNLCFAIPAALPRGIQLCVITCHDILHQLCCYKYQWSSFGGPSKTTYTIYYNIL